MFLEPMLAAKLFKTTEPIEDELFVKRRIIESVRFPVIASPKADGIRAVRQGEDIFSRSGKLIRNRSVTHVLRQTLPNGYDGEIITYTNGKMDDFNTVQSKVMSGDGQSDFIFFVLDDMSIPEIPYTHRIIKLAQEERTLLQDTITKLMPTKYIENVEALLEYEAECLAAGWEGICFRSPGGQYKHGRSTLREGGLVKLKRYKEAEGLVLGWEEELENTNEKTVDARGLGARSSHASGLIPKGRLGVLLLSAAPWGIVKVGTGFSAADRTKLWAVRDSLIGKKVTFKYFPHGELKAPRHPVFKGIRLDI